jgi:tetratricopeptide (TPR) repeat protein
MLGSAAAQSPEARKHYQEAQRLFALNERDRAMEELKKSIQLSPDFVDAQRLYLDNNFDKAKDLIPQYETYVQENPSSAVFRYLLGKAYSNANQREKSDAEFKKALELDPNFGWALLAAGTVASRAGDRDKAVELWKKAASAADSAQLRYTAASNLLSNRVYDVALEQAEKILQTDPAHFDAWRIKWQAKLNLSFGSDDARAEVLKDIKKLESEHGKDIRALLAIMGAYQSLDDEQMVEKTRQAITAIDAKYFERQPTTLGFGTPSGKVVRLTGVNARRFMDANKLKDDRAKLEIYRQMEKELDPDAKLYVVYPAMLRSLVALGDIESAKQLIAKMIEAKTDAHELAQHKIALARAAFEKKTDLDLALDYARGAAEELRKPAPKMEDKGPDAASSAEEMAEYAKSQLASALHLQGQLLLAKGLAAEAASALEESVGLKETEASAIDLGLASAKLDRADKAIEMLARGYAYEGKRKEEALTALKPVYADREKTRPLKAMLDEAVSRHRSSVREEAIAKALREMTRTEKKAAPQFTLATLDGRRLALSDLVGKVALLNFWATW